MQVNPIIGPTPFTNGLGEGATKSLPDAFHVVDFTACHQFAKVFGEAAKHATCVLVGADSKHIGPLKFEQDGNLMQDVGNLIP